MHFVFYNCSTLLKIKKNAQTTSDSSLVPCNKLKSLSSDILKPNIPTTIQGMNLSDFATQYFNALPAHVIVLNSYSNNNIVLQKGDHCCIQSITKNNTILVKENRKLLCELPLSSSDNFGLVCNPNASQTEQSIGCNFHSISEILQLESLPLAMKCTLSKSPLVKKGETLIIQGKGRNPSGEEVLNSYSVTLNIQRSLTATCIASFTTQPQKVQLPLSKIVQHLPNAFPLTVMPFSDEIRKVAGPQSVLTLEYNAADSIVMNFGSSAAVVSVPISAPILVGLDNGLSQMQMHSANEMSNAIQMKPEQSATNEYANLKPIHNNKDEQIEDSDSFEVTIRNEIDSLKSEIAEVKDIIKQIQMKIDSVHIEKMQHPEISKVTTSQQDKEMPQLEVFEILSSMGLAQYEAAFKKKRLTRDNLRKMTDDILKNDLEVKSKIHRTKLLEAFRSLQ